MTGPKNSEGIKEKEQHVGQSCFLLQHQTANKMRSEINVSGRQVWISVFESNIYHYEAKAALLFMGGICNI